MSTEEKIKESLDTILVPGVARSLSKLNLIKNVAISDGIADVTIASAALSQETQEWLKAKVQEVVKKLPDVKDVNVAFDTELKPKDINEIGRVIAVMSGKGGVGKSLVTGLAAISLARCGLEVGILDADITGPSIPKMFGISGHPKGSENGLLPVLSRSGIETCLSIFFSPMKMMPLSGEDP